MMSGAIVLCLLCFCGRQGNYQEGTLRIFKQADVTTLDPMFSNDVTSGELCALIYDGLVQFGEDLTVTGCLAEKWEIREGGREYTFILRKGTRFTNGREVTAPDVKYSFERVLEPKGKSDRRWLFDKVAGALDYYYGRTGEVKGIQVVDRYTLKITLEKPHYLFLQFLAMPGALVVPREEVEKRGEDFARHPVGSGPWQLEEWKANDYISLVPNPVYYGGAPQLKRIVYRIIPETMTATSEFEVGNLDIMKIPDAEFDRWIQDEKWKPYILAQEKLAVTYIGLNNQKEKFKDRRVRQALNYAIDVKAILESIIKGRGRLALGSVPPLLLGMEGPGKDVHPYPYDPDRARQLLAEAGFTDGFNMEIWQKHNPETGKILEAVQAYLAEVNIKVKIQTRDWGSFKQAINKGEPDAFYLDWYADYPDAENFLFPLFHSTNWGGEGNRARYWNHQADSLLDSARVIGDKPRRDQVYRQANRIIFEDAPWIFLWHPRTYVVGQPWVKDFRVPVVYNGSKLLQVRVARD